MHCYYTLQFFPVNYTQMLVPETQRLQHVTHAQILPNYKRNSCFTLKLKHTRFKTLHTNLCTWHQFVVRKIFCFHTKHTVIQNSKVNCPTVHLSHSFTVSNYSFRIQRATGELCYCVLLCSENKNNILKYFTAHLCMYCL